MASAQAQKARRAAQFDLANPALGTVPFLSNLIGEIDEQER